MSPYHHTETELPAVMGGQGRADHEIGSAIDMLARLIARLIGAAK